MKFSIDPNNAFNPDTPDRKVVDMVRGASLYGLYVEMTKAVIRESKDYDELNGALQKQITKFESMQARCMQAIGFKADSNG